MPSAHGPKVDAFYDSHAWKKARSAALDRARYLCERCGRPAEIVHHIIHLDENNVDDPSISINVDNLECLCLACHNTEHYAKPRRSMRFDSDGNVVEIFDD